MIPKTFKLLNRTWKVRLSDYEKMQKYLDQYVLPFHEDEEDQTKAKDCFGFCDPARAEIHLNVPRHTDETQLLHTFWHELMHAIFFTEGLVNHDEAQIDRFGAYMQQITETMR